MKINITPEPIEDWDLYFNSLYGDYPEEKLIQMLQDTPDDSIDNHYFIGWVLDRLSK